MTDALSCFPACRTRCAAAAGSTPRSWGRLEGGYECDVLALSSAAGDLVVRVCPAWRTLAGDAVDAACVSREIRAFNALRT